MYWCTQRHLQRGREVSGVLTHTQESWQQGDSQFIHLFTSKTFISFGNLRDILLISQGKELFQVITAETDVFRHVIYDPRPPNLEKKTEFLQLCMNHFWICVWMFFGNHMCICNKNYFGNHGYAFSSPPGSFRTGWVCWQRQLFQPKRRDWFNISISSSPYIEVKVDVHKRVAFPIRAVVVELSNLPILLFDDLEARSVRLKSAIACMELTL